MDFHLQTILTTTALVGALLTVLQAIAAARLRSAPLVCWAASTACITLSSIVIVLRPVIGLVPSVLAGNWLVLVSMGLIFSGVRLFDGRSARFEMVGLVSILGVCILVLSLSTGDRMADRVTIMSLLAAGWAAAAGTALLRGSGSGPLVSRLASGILLAAVACLYAVRGVGAQLGIFATPGGGLPNPIEAFVVILGFGLCIAWIFGGLFMVLERLASLDDLTGLSNRRATLQRGADLLRAARARGRPFSLLIADLDHFKQVNDRFGHDVGDAVLRRFASTVAQAVGPADVVGRHGGEEFCILLPDADHAAALKTAERLRLLVQAELRQVAGHDTGVTLTIGLASYTPGLPGFDKVPALMGAADAALYAAKTQGRNRVASAAVPNGKQGPALPSVTRRAAQPIHWAAPAEAHIEPPLAMPAEPARSLIQARGQGRPGHAGQPHP